MSTQPVQNALTVLVSIKAEAVNIVRDQLKQGVVAPTGLDAVGTVHFARIFVIEQNNPAGIASNILGLITSYDGDFNLYVQDFVNQPTVAEFFDLLLSVVDDPAAAGLIPVTKNAAAFAALIEKYDITNPAKSWGQWYSAYPTLTVQRILHLS